MFFCFSHRKRDGIFRNGSSEVFVYRDLGGATYKKITLINQRRDLKHATSILNAKRIYFARGKLLFFDA